MLRHEIIAHIDDLPVYFSSHRQSTQLVPSHWHKHVEVLYIANGNMTIILNTDTHLLRSGDIFVINSEYIHSTIVKDFAELFLLQIPYDFLDSSIRNMDFIHFREHFSCLNLGKNNHFKTMQDQLLTMHKIYSKKEDGYPFLFNSALNTFLYELYANFTTSKSDTTLAASDKQREHLKKAIDYMSANYKEAISLQEIASHLALNQEYFCRMFKKNIGTTFLHYLNQIRLTHIYSDLLNTRDSITNLQERHGFTNYKVFNRMFKETYGCTPSQVRKNLDQWQNGNIRLAEVYVSDI